MPRKVWNDIVSWQTRRLNNSTVYQLHALMTKACDKRLNRLISYIHHTCDYRQYCYVGGLFQDSDFAGDLQDSKSTSGGTLCVFGSHIFMPRNTIQTPERSGRPVNDKNQRSQEKTNVLNHIDCVPSNVQCSHQKALLYVFEDNEAVIKMIIKEEALQ